MPRQKLLISLSELTSAFDRLPVTGHHPKETFVLDIKLDEGGVAFLEFVWDYNDEHWQLNADNVIITKSKSYAGNRTADYRDS